jgi:hypothetical protein
MDEQERKARGKAAIERYYKRQEPKAQRKSVHNDKPEKEVEKACLAWMREMNWTVAIYESKATYSEAAGRYISQNMKAGTADCMGNMASGIGVIVEFKAPKKLSTFARPANHRQQEFMKEKIRSGCFACVTDSVTRLYTIYMKWVDLRGLGLIDESKEYLLEMLPKRQKQEDNTPLF